MLARSSSSNDFLFPFPPLARQRAAAFACFAARRRLAALACELRLGGAEAAHSVLRESQQQALFFFSFFGFLAACCGSRSSRRVFLQVLFTYYLLIIGGGGRCGSRSRRSVKKKGRAFFFFFLAQAGAGHKNTHAGEDHRFCFFILFYEQQERTLAAQRAAIHGGAARLSCQRPGLWAEEAVRESVAQVAAFSCFFLVFFFLRPCSGCWPRPSFPRPFFLLILSPQELPEVQRLLAAGGARGSPNELDLKVLPALSSFLLFCPHFLFIINFLLIIIFLFFAARPTSLT